MTAGQLRGRVALVTGAGIRVGRAIAIQLARQGAAVAVHYNSSSSDAAETTRLVREMGGRAVALQADLMDTRAPYELVRQTLDSFGTLDLLVNSAAIMEKTDFANFNVDAWDRTMNLNLRAPFILSSASADALRASTYGGAIVNISDLAAYETWPDYPVHGISKGGVITMTRYLARLLAPAIRVNCVAPGAVLLPEDWSEEDARKVAESTPLRRLGSTEDVADAVCYLASASYVTGEVLLVDGGRHIRR